MQRSDSEEAFLINTAVPVPRHKRWFVKEAFVEMFCTMLFVYVGCGTIISVPPPIDATGMTNPASLLAIALTHGFGIVALVYASAKVSGGHINPAVTLAALIAGKVKVKQAIMYWIFQLFGAFVGGLVLMGATPEERWGSLGSQTLAPGTTIVQGIVWETIMSFALCTVVVSTALRRNDDMGKHAAMAIGITLLVCILSGGTHTGASLNPARTFGPAAARSVTGSYPAGLWTYQYVYWAGPAIGGIISGLIGRFALR